MTGFHAPIGRLWIIGACAIAAAAMLALCALGGCQDQAFLNAERSTYNAVAPEYLRYVEADPSLDPLAKARRRRTVELWDRDLRLREQSYGGVSTTRPGAG